MEQYKEIIIIKWMTNINYEIKISENNRCSGKEAF